MMYAGDELYPDDVTSGPASEWQPEPDGLTVRVWALDHAAGSVVLFRGSVADGRACLFAASHREAQDIVTALEAGDPVYASVQPWQLLG